MDRSAKSGTSLKRPRLKRPRARKNSPGRDGWLRAAHDALIREGIGGVEIGKLARKLQVTRGGFYWFFDSRKQLLNRLLADWEENNSRVFFSVRNLGTSGAVELKTLSETWIHENGYHPQWDAAVREWARISPRVAIVVRRVDDARIAAIRRIFQDIGYAEPEAFIRARITYFHQVGYYALGVQESREQRMELLPIYMRILTGASS
jgi:AcrR family transcriptional regulator